MIFVVYILDSFLYTIPSNVLLSDSHMTINEFANYSMIIISIIIIITVFIN